MCEWVYLLFILIPTFKKIKILDFSLLYLTFQFEHMALYQQKQQLWCKSPIWRSVIWNMMEMALKILVLMFVCYPQIPPGLLIRKTEKGKKLNLGKAQKCTFSSLRTNSIFIQCNSALLLLLPHYELKCGKNFNSCLPQRENIPCVF